MTGARASRSRDVPGRRGCPDQEAGSALVEFVGLGAVMLIPIVYALITVLDIQRAAYGVSAAARAWGRAYQLSGPSQAAAAADLTLGDQGLRLADATVSTTCVGERGSCTGPGGAVRVTVGYRVSLPLVPGWAGSAGSVGVSGEHVAAFGQYRDPP